MIQPGNLHFVRYAVALVPLDATGAATAGPPLPLIPYKQRALVGALLSQGPLWIDRLMDGGHE